MFYTTEDTGGDRRAQGCKRTSCEVVEIKLYCYAPTARGEKRIHEIANSAK